MMKDPAEEMVAETREAEAAPVSFVEEKVSARLRVGQMKMEVGPGAGSVRERFGHEGGDRTELAGHLPGHHPEEGQAIRGREGVGIAKVDLVLKIRVLVVELIDSQPSLFRPSLIALQEAERGRHALVVIARLLQVVDAVRVPSFDRTVVTRLTRKNSGSIPTLKTKPASRAFWRTLWRFTLGQNG